MWIDIIGQFEKYEKENSQNIGKKNKSKFKKMLDRVKKEWYDYKEIKEERNREKNKRDLYRKLFDNMIEKF